MSSRTMKRFSLWLLSLTTSLANLCWYGKWVDCHHDWEPEGFADWRCSSCGVSR